MCKNWRGTWIRSFLLRQGTEATEMNSHEDYALWYAEGTGYSVYSIRLRCWCICSESANLRHYNALRRHAAILTERSPQKRSKGQLLKLPHDVSDVRYLDATGIQQPLNFTRPHLPTAALKTESYDLGYAPQVRMDDGMRRRSPLSMACSMIFDCHKRRSKQPLLALAWVRARLNIE